MTKVKWRQTDIFDPNLWTDLCLLGPPESETYKKAQIEIEGQKRWKKMKIFQRFIEINFRNKI